MNIREAYQSDRVRLCRKFGGGYAKVQELGGPTISQVYKLTWEREYLDLAELARLRWTEGWKIQELANHFMISESGIKERIRAIKRNPNRIKEFNTKKNK